MKKIISYTLAADRSFAVGILDSSFAEMNADGRYVFMPEDTPLFDRSEGLENNALGLVTSFRTPRQIDINLKTAV